MTDSALDLSAKSTSVTQENGNASHQPHEPETPSPTRTPPRHDVISDDNDSNLSAPGSASVIKPIAGPIPRSLRDSPCSNPDLSHADKSDSQPSSPSASIGSGRPFKSFGFDSMPSMFSSSSSALLASHSGHLAAGLPVGLTLSSLYESSSAFPSFPVTPLTSHLLQRKRRAESRSSSGSGNENSDDIKKLKHVAEENKDGSYWERRRKNNEAAKRSRDNRRHKEEEIAMRAAFLEQENLKLRAQVAILKNETAKLHYMLYNRL